MKKVAFLIACLTVIIGCNETKEVAPFPTGSDYYPVKAGEYRVYQVEEIRFDLLGNDTSVYQLREYVSDSILTTDVPTYVLTREKRDSDQDEWVVDSLWTFNKSSRQLKITENNIPFVKLTFPIVEASEWNGNAFNTRPDQTYFYQAMTEPRIDTIAAEDHIRVVIAEIPETIVGQDMKSEVYVKGVGLIEKDYITQVKCTSGDCGDNTGKVESGRSLKQTLIELSK